MSNHDLAATARELVAAGKGILAADESTGTMNKRLTAVDVTPDEKHRRAFRELVVTTPRLSDSISGIILYDETFRQRTWTGTLIPDAAAYAGVLPGIKVDTGAKPLAECPQETVTEGRDGLRERLSEYTSMGARFAKWRAVIRIGEGRPTSACVRANAHALARYAALCQESGVVPIVEPEVLMDGGHTLSRAEEVTAEVLCAVFTELDGQNVALDGMVLKPNMVVPGADSGDRHSVDEVAGATLRCLREMVPASVPGVAFLSGGQSDEAATLHLNAMSRQGTQPWELTFSYGRALLAPALSVWRGDTGKIAAAQRTLEHRARCNAAARDGKYSPEMEDELPGTLA